MEQRVLRHITEDFYSWIVDGACPPKSQLSKFRQAYPTDSDDLRTIVVDFLNAEPEAFKWLFAEWVRTLSAERQAYYDQLL